MGTLLHIVTPLHKRTKRDYLARMVDDKIHCMKVAKRYGFDYWDGDRRYGYGGYHYDGRWETVARKLIRHYKLSNSSKILDVGCGKAHLLFEIKKLLPGVTVVGIDISRYGMLHAPKEIQPYLKLYKAEDPYPWSKNNFDLVISLATLHNLVRYDLEKALKEVERAGKNKFVMVESYRNDQELFNLQCWALTAQTFMRNDEWIWFYKDIGYTGDYEFIYFS